MRQQGIALITSLVFLLIVTAVSVVAAQRGGSNLRMVSNMQESAAAFQRAEEGIYQAVAEHETNNIFQAADVGTTNTIVNTTDIQVTVRVDAMEGACARVPNGFSQALIQCDSFHIRSTKQASETGHGRARAEVDAGMVSRIGAGFVSGDQSTMSTCASHANHRACWAGAMADTRTRTPDRGPPASRLRCLVADGHFRRKTR